MKTRSLRNPVLPLLMLLGLSPAVQAAANRPAWVVNELYAWNHPYAAQASGELAVKMQKMDEGGPFAFYRGTAHVFYRDMMTLPASAYTTAASRQVWIDADMHLQNFGGMKDDAGNYVFDISDFDEGWFGPYVWDIRRMAVSILLAARENGLPVADQEQCVKDFIDAYLNKMSDFKGTGDELSYRLTTANTSEVVKDVIQAAAAKTRSGLLAKYTSVSNGGRKFQSLPDLVSLNTATYNGLKTGVAAYVSGIPSGKRYAASFYTVKDIRQKLGSGVGSLGKLRYFVLLEGASTSTADDVILEMKQQSASAAALAAPTAMPSTAYAGHHGYRMVRSAKAMVSNADRLYGYATVNGLPFSLREKSPWQEDFDYTALGNYDKFNTAVEYMGRALARAHALGDKDYDSTLIPFSQDKEISDAVTSVSGFKSEILGFARDYADQVTLDWQAFRAARAAGAVLY